MLLSKALEGYFYDKAATYSPHTIASYRLVFRNFLAYIGDKDLAEITPANLHDFILYMKEDYKPVRWNKADVSAYAPASVDIHWKGVRSFFHWANRQLGVPRPDLDMPRPQFKRPRVVPFTEDEIRALVKATEYTAVQRGETKYTQRRPSSHRDKAIVLTLLDTGLRVGELLRIQLKDVNFEAGEIVVAPFGSGKKSRPRMVVLGATARRALWLYVARFEYSRPTDRLFPMNVNAIRLMLKRLGDRAGVAGVHPHRFRHSFAIWYLRNGGDIFTLQRLLGHSTLDMVNYYLDIAQSDMALAHARASAVDRFNANRPL